MPEFERLDDARAWLREHLDEGVACPCCTQRAQVYHRRINAGMAHSLITMYLAAGQTWVHVPTVVGSASREEGKLAYWGLLEEERALHRDDGGRAGYWRVTPKGEQFVLGRLWVPKFAHIYDGRCLGFDYDERVSIYDALGDRFDYRELMAGV